MSFRVQSMEGVNRWIASIADGCWISRVRRDPVHAQRSPRNLRPIFVARTNAPSRFHERICQCETFWILSRKFTLSHRIYLKKKVCPHRPYHLVSTGPNKLLRPTGNDAVRHCLCIVSHLQVGNQLSGISYDIVFDIDSGVTIWGFGVPGGEP